METETPREEHPIFTLQWHLTTDCPNNCKHCYVERNAKTLSLEDCKRVIDDFRSLLERWNCDGRIHFTGGDPLLYPYFFELLSYTRFQIPNIIIGILGNPELLTGDIVIRLKEKEVSSYQMSLDGLEKTHDYFRYPGSFMMTIEKLKLLKRFDIKTAIMTTVSKANLNEIPAVIDLVTENEVNVFDFQRFVPLGKGNIIKEQSFISPFEYRELLIKIDRKYKEYVKSRTLFGRKEPLWILFQTEERVFHKTRRKEDDNLIWDGCPLGSTIMTILEDGTVFPCRRVPKSIGRVPTQNLRKIFIFSERLNKMRRIENLKKCNDCELLYYCRGCRSSANAVRGNYYDPDPQCWK